MSVEEIILLISLITIGISVLIFGIAYIVWAIKNKKQDIFSDIKPAQGECLDNISNLLAVDRKYYGNDKNNKPSYKCYWDKDAYIEGWYENNDSLRKRCLEVYNK